MLLVSKMTFLRIQQEEIIKKEGKATCYKMDEEGVLWKVTSQGDPIINS